MEHIISKLVDEFANGRMSRRQLIQTLTVAAAGTGAASTAVAAENKGFKAVTVNHISYRVKDYAKTRDFYVDLLGMKVSGDTGRQANLSFGDTFLFPRNGREGGTTPQVDHIAYTIENWNAADVGAELRRRGHEPRVDTENSFHIKDPDGFDLQISGKDMKA